MKAKATGVNGIILAKNDDNQEIILKAVAESIQHLLAIRDIYKATGKCFELLGTAVFVDRVYLFQNEYDNLGNGFTSQRIEWNSGEDAPQIDNPLLQRLPFNTIQGVINTIINLGAFSEIVRDIEDEGARLILEEQNIQSVIIIPIYVRGIFWGFIGFDECTYERTWLESEFSILKAFGHALEEAIERSMIEEELIAARKAAEEASKAKSEFLANMSHEIRTPLNAVIGFTDLLINMKQDPVQRQYVENINTSAHALMGLINDILDFSKIEAGKLELDEVKTDIVEIAEQAVDMIKMTAAKKNLELLLNINPEMPRFLHLDPIRLRQILANLLSNAVKFTGQGEVELSISFTQDPEIEDKGRFTFSVRDTGIGISEEQQGKLFKAFSQADTSTTRKYGGTGLGLVITGKLLEKMGSELKLKSKPGVGSQFYFTLENIYESSKVLPSDTITMIHRVLVIDDNEHNRMILQHMLKYWGIASDAVADGIEALSIFENRNDYDVIMVDYNMPYYNGIEVIGKLRERFISRSKHQPAILMFSSSDDASILQECKKHDIEMRMIKPIKMHDLYQILERLHTTDIHGKKAQVSLMSHPITSPEQAMHEPQIMIVEDNPMNMMLSKIIVKQIIPHGKIIEAVNGVDGVEKYQLHQPDIILMDIQMPEKDGYVATREIRALEKNRKAAIPIIALTASAFKGDIEQCMAAGMNDFLTKPVQKQAFREVLEKHFASWLEKNMT